MNGGKREGAGRPKALPVGHVRFTVSLEQYRVYKELGGSRKVKRELLQAIDDYYDRNSK